MRQSFSMEHALASGKFSAPAGHAQQVPRDLLCEQICAEHAPRVAIVRGPAGFGKTTLLSQCQTRLRTRITNPVQTAWLNLDRADNDATRFLRCLMAALRSLSLAPGERLGADTARVADDALAMAVIVAVATQREPFALFLDDFELITEPAVLDLVQDLLNHLPAHGRLLIGSRHFPGLSLGRLRSGGHVLEVDATQLSFSELETSRFFALRQTTLGPAQIGLLHRKTEGWIAALWLASLSLARQPSPDAFVARFSGTDQSVADYLSQDVLASQPPELQAFLLRTSILKQLSVPVCEALLPQADCERLLSQLESTQVLLTRLSTDERSYRFHSLFSTYLQSQLRVQAPQEIAGLHAAASAWYLEQGRPVPAIDHAIEGGDFVQAMQLLQAHAMSLLAEGRMRLLSRWFAQLPAAVLSTEPELQAVQVWATCFTSGPAEAALLLDDLGLANCAQAEVQAHVRALQPLLLSMMDRHEEAFVVGMPSVAKLGEPLSFTDTALANAMANVTAVLGRYHEARALLDTARRAQSLAASSFNLMYSEAVEGIIDLQEGRMRQAGARFQMAVRATRSGAFSLANGNAWAGVMYAAWIYETGDLAQASRLLQVYVPLGRDVGLPDHLILGYVMLARIAFYAGDAEQTFYLLGELEYLGHQRRLPRIAASARVERARVLVMQGHGLAAREELRRAQDDDLWARVHALRLPANDLMYPRLGQLRWEAFEGDPALALTELLRDIDVAREARRHRRVLKMQLLCCAAYGRQGDDARAFSLAAQIVAVAQAEGLCRVIVDEGAAVTGVLLRFIESAAFESWRVDYPGVDDWLARFRKQLWTGVATPEPATSAPHKSVLAASPAEALTPKELLVLRLLAEGHSNVAIATRLFVSESTVRTHLRHLNVKLHADSRTQAVALARRAGLL